MPSEWVGFSLFSSKHFHMSNRPRPLEYLYSSPACTLLTPFCFRVFFVCFLCFLFCSVLRWLILWFGFWTRPMMQRHTTHTTHNFITERSLFFLLKPLDYNNNNVTSLSTLFVGRNLWHTCTGRLYNLVHIHLLEAQSQARLHSPSVWFVCRCCCCCFYHYYCFFVEKRTQTHFTTQQLHWMNDLLSTHLAV